MSLHTTTRIRIEGRKDLAETFQFFELHELIDGHHRFKLELPGRHFGRGKGTGFWQELVGRRIHIEITPADKNLPYASKEFSGLITGVSLGKSYGPHGNIVLKGGSPTLLLDDDPHMAAFAEQPLGQIVEQQLSAYPDNLLRPQVNPATTDPLEYKVQYKENTWQLLQRL
ncbi:MAG TPA: contractile injection system protein, VgrG/Pvc8 family, partial [Fodinibius sp.]|nr:contractile injection system protein, VgrG/Pvc8 family [Fodinibius sp.]